MSTLLWLSYAALWGLVVVQGLALLEVLRQIGSIRERLPAEKPMVVVESVAIGDVLPPLTANSATNLEPARWDTFLKSRLNVVLFLTTRCANCYAIAQDLGPYITRIEPNVGCVVVLWASVREAQAFLTATGLDDARVVIDEAGATSERLGIRFVPAGLLVSDGKLGQAAIVGSLAQLEALVERGIVEAEELEVGAGQPAPRRPQET